MNVSKINEGSGDFWKMFCQRTLCPGIAKTKLQSVEVILSPIHTYKSNASVEVRRCCCRQTHVRVVGDDGAAIDISNKVDR